MNSKIKIFITFWQFIVLLIVQGCYQASQIEADSSDRSDNIYDSETDSDNILNTDVNINDTSETDWQTDSETDRGTDSDGIAETNYALYFDGSGDYVRIPHDDVLNLSDQWTIECWFLFYNEDDTLQPILRKGDELIKVSAYFLYARYEGEYSIAGYGISESKYLGLKSINPLQAGMWTHMAFTYDHGISELYINGELINRIDKSADNTSVKTTSRDLIIGAILTSSNTGYFYGMIDEIRISSIDRYNINFTPEEAFSTDNNTIALWHFNEGGGTTVTDS
ncbi:MAG: hypothetical protein JXR91_13690, partial [Deltaproteobacteria bacterium]|nr:hypothetical protein [Deltaproteobacteria bacterium]